MFHLSFREWSILPTESGLGLKERYIPILLSAWELGINL